MTICVAYLDESMEPIGYRDVKENDVVIDEVLQARGGIADILFDPPLIYLYEGISINSPDEYCEIWCADALFELPEFSQEKSWFCYNLTIDLLAKKQSSIAEAIGFELTELRSLFTIDSNTDKAGWEWLNFREPSFTIRIPITFATTYGEILKSVEEVHAIVLEVAEQVRKLSVHVRSSPMPERYRQSRRKAFLCHSSRDKPFVRKLTRALSSNGIDVWLDEEKILVGHDFTVKMEEGIEKADFVIVVLSPNFVNHGPWAQEEFRTALTRQVSEQKVRVLPVLKKDCDIPLILKAKHYADFRGRFETGLSRLLTSIQRHQT